VSGGSERLYLLSFSGVTDMWSTGVLLPAYRINAPTIRPAAKRKKLYGYPACDGDENNCTGCYLVSLTCTLISLTCCCILTTQLSHNQTWKRTNTYFSGLKLLLHFQYHKPDYSVMCYLTFHILTCNFCIKKLCPVFPICCLGTIRFEYQPDGNPAWRKCSAYLITSYH
jgi:hypothetical protein